MANPLLTIHQQAEAEFQNYAQTEIVSTFGEPAAEYAAIRKSAALVDLPQRGFLQLTGRDRLVFLNNLLTNQTYDKEAKTPMAAGRSVYAFLLNAKSGRIIADMNVLGAGGSWNPVLEMDARGWTATVRTELDKYLFGEKVQISDESEKLHEIALHGPGAETILSNVLGPMENCQMQLVGTELLMWRDDPASVPGYHLIFPAESARAIWMHLVSQYGVASDIGKRALRPAGWAAFNAARIEGGRPIFGIDFDETILPAETGQLERAVSFTKGCYPGQEIVARMHARQQVAKQLVGIRFSDDALPIAGSPIQDDSSNVVGGITSSTISPVLSNIAIAMGLVRKQFVPVGTIVNVPAEGAMRRGVVCEMPFIQNSNEKVKKP